MIVFSATPLALAMRYQTYHHNRNYGCRVTEFVLKGHRCVTLENELLRVTVLADKGTDIYEFLYKPRDVDFMWRTWLGLRERSHFLPTSARDTGAHMDYYEGGWQELFPNCGAASFHQGVDVGQHGEVLLLPWDYAIVTDEPDRVEVTFNVRTVRTPFHLVKTVSLERNRAVLRIHERVTNEGGQAVDFSWGHHPVFGWPFIDESCRVDLPDCTIRTYSQFSPATSRLKSEQSSVWPNARGNEARPVDLSHVAGPDAGAHDMVFLEGIKDGWYAITNTTRRVGFGMRYPAEVFKRLWYWQVYRGDDGYPWWRSTYNVALEPCTSLPVLADAVGRGEALTLQSGESREIDLVAVAYEGLDRVNGITAEGEVH